MQTPFLFLHYCDGIWSLLYIAYPNNKVNYDSELKNVSIVRLNCQRAVSIVCHAWCGRFSTEPCCKCERPVFANVQSDRSKWQDMQLCHRCWWLAAHPPHSSGLYCHDDDCSSCSNCGEWEITHNQGFTWIILLLLTNTYSVGINLLFLAPSNAHIWISQNYKCGFMRFKKKNHPLNISQGCIFWILTLLGHLERDVAPW